MKITQLDETLSNLLHVISKASILGQEKSDTDLINKYTDLKYSYITLLLDNFSSIDDLNDKSKLIHFYLVENGVFKNEAPINPLFFKNREVPCLLNHILDFLPLSIQEKIKTENPPFPTFLNSISIPNIKLDVSLNKIKVLSEESELQIAKEIGNFIKRYEILLSDHPFHFVVMSRNPIIHLPSSSELSNLIIDAGFGDKDKVNDLHVLKENYIKALKGDFLSAQILNLKNQFTTTELIDKKLSV